MGELRRQLAVEAHGRTQFQCSLIWGIVGIKGGAEVVDRAGGKCWSPAEEDGWGLRSTSTETHSPHTFPLPHTHTHPSPGHYKNSAHAEVVQSHQLLQTAIMKFVSLALCLLLAVGSYADVPSQLEQIRSVMDVFLTQVKDGVKQALDQVDEAEYQDFKVQMMQRLDDAHIQIKTVQSSVSPVVDGIAKTFSEAFEPVYQSISTDVESLKTSLEPQRTALKQVLDKHIEEYRLTMMPVLNEYKAQNAKIMSEMMSKFQAMIETLKGQMAVNIEETKDAMMPIVDAVRGKISKRVTELKDLIKPYVDEYKDQMQRAIDQAKSVTGEDMEALRAKIAPLAEDIKEKFRMIADIVVASYSQS
ncbi:apolipoprotein A-I-like [Aulostomus maculatus]